MKINKINLFLLITATVSGYYTVMLSTGSGCLDNKISLYISLYTAFAASFNVILSCICSFALWKKKIKKVSLPQYSYFTSTVFILIVGIAQLYKWSFFQDLESFSNRGGLLALTTTLLILNFIISNINETKKDEKNKMKKLF